LRIFLKGDPRHGLKGEIEEYAGIEIEWKRGKRAVMTIFDDEKQQAIEEVKLYELQTRAEMHKLMEEKGFLKKTAEQKAAEITVARRENQLRAIERPMAVYDTLTGLYLVVFALIGVGAFVLHRGKRRGKPIRAVGSA